MSQLTKVESRLYTDEVKVQDYHYKILPHISRVKNTVLVHDLTMYHSYRLFHYDTEILTLEYDRFKTKLNVVKCLPVSNSSSRAIQQVLTHFDIEESPKELYESLSNKKLKDLRKAFKNGEI